MYFQDNGAYPFGWCYVHDSQDGDVEKLFIGDEGETHNSVTRKAIIYGNNEKIYEFGENAECIDGVFENDYGEEYKFKECPYEYDDDDEYYFEEENYIVLDEFGKPHITYTPSEGEYQNMSECMYASGRYYVYDGVIMFWNNMDRGNFIKYVNELSKAARIDFSNYTYIYHDEDADEVKWCKVYEFMNNEENDNKTFTTDDRQNKGIHLMKQSEKRDALKDFRKFRDDMYSKKLGNITMAQYNNIIHQESKKNWNRLVENVSTNNRDFAYPDETKIYELKLDLFFKQQGAYAFGFCTVEDDNAKRKVNKLFIGNEGGTHQELINDVISYNVTNIVNHYGSKSQLTGYFHNKETNEKYNINRCKNDLKNKDGKISFNIKNYIPSDNITYNHGKYEFKEMSDTMKISGRFYTKQKAILFWNKVDANTMKNTISKLSEKTNIDFSNYLYIFYNEDDKIEWCTVKDYIKNDRGIENTTDDRLNKGIHLMSQDDKRNSLKDFRTFRDSLYSKKLGSMTTAEYNSLIHQESKNNGIKLVENLEVEVEPDEVDLSSFELEDSLNNEIWLENNKLNPNIRLKLLDIADDFFNSLEVNFVEPIDIILTGSLCNYNWSEFSDIDLHIIVNFDEISDRTDFVKEYFDSKKNEWNNEHKDLKIYDFPIELYVQNSNEYGISYGMYSLEKDEWIKKPNENDFEELNAAKIKKIKSLASKIMTKIDDYFDYFSECDDKHKLEILYKKIDILLEKIKLMRKHGLDENGEMSIR